VRDIGGNGTGGREIFPEVTILIMTAAVADFRPQGGWHTEKKRRMGCASDCIGKDTDILAEVSRNKGIGWWSFCG